MSKEKNHSRREFLRKAVSLVAITAVGMETNFLKPGRLLASNGDQALGIYTVDLTKYSALKNVNGSVAITIQGAKPATSIVLTRTSATTFEAVNRTCTHQGFLVGTCNASSQRITCPAHGSQFTAAGIVQKGPATRNLPNYTTHYDAVNSPNTVTIDIPTLSVGAQDLTLDPVLYQNFPNPVRETTTIRFTLGYASPVVLTVTDILGNIIAVLNDGELEAGEHSFTFDASIWNSGIYQYHLNIEGQVLTKQMIITK